MRGLAFFFLAVFGWSSFGSFELCRKVNQALPAQLTSWTSLRYSASDPGNIQNYLAMKYSILPFEKGDPRIAELGKMMTESGPEELPAKLEAWGKKHGVPFQFIYANSFGPNDIEPTNGYVVVEVYKKSILAGRFPLIDPHDLISHVPDLLDSRFVDGIKDHARATLSARQAFSFSLVEYLQSTVRQSTYEGNCFLYTPPSSKNPTLILRGNGGYNSIAALLGGRSEDVLNRLASAPIGRDPIYWMDPEYRATSAGKAFLERQHKAMERIGKTSDTSPVVRQKLSSILEDLMSESKRSRLDYSDPKTFAEEEKRVDTILEKLAKAIAADPILREVFSEKNRLEALESSTALAQDYLRWDQNREIP